MFCWLREFAVDFCSIAFAASREWLVSLLFLKKPPGLEGETSKINKQASVERSM